MISDQKQKVPQYRGMFHAASTIVRSEGFFGIYKGVGPTIIKQGSNQAIRFTVMETLRKMYTGGDNRVSVPMHMVSDKYYSSSVFIDSLMLGVSVWSHCWSLECHGEQSD